jgi:DNA-binding CsgD family transcriptional regulator
MSVRGSRLTLPTMSSDERARSAYVAAALDGDLRAAPRLDGGSLWATAARAHVLLHGDGDLDAAHRLLVDAIDGRADPDGEPEALTAALDTLLMVCRFADREALWAPYRALVAGHAARVPAAPDPTEPDPTEPDPTELDPTGLDPTGAVRAGWSLLDVDGVERRGAALRRVLDDGRHGGAVGPAINAAVLLALDAFAAGRWDDTCRLAEQAQVLCASHGHEALAMMTRVGPALVAASRGDEAACHDHTSAMIGWAAPRGARLVHRHAIHARVLAALGRGDAESAYHLAATITPPGAVEPAGAGRLSVMDLVEAAVRTQRRDEAAAHVRGALGAGISDVSARSALLVAGAAALAEHGDRARARYEQALAAPGLEAWPFDVARVRLAYGEHLRRSRAMLDARLQLTTAVATFRRLGADPWIARAESELRAAGHRVHRARGMASTVLSHQERTVARLAATGATNRQIGQQLGLSPRTVGSHLTRAFQKMRVTSRAALGEALRAAEPAAHQD